jgi:hypothetical protein
MSTAVGLPDVTNVVKAEILNAWHAKDEEFWPTHTSRIFAECRQVSAELSRKLPR